MASLKTRIAKLEAEKIRSQKAEPPQGLSLIDQYLWLIGQPASRAPAQSKYSPEQAYRIISRGL